MYGHLTDSQMNQMIGTPKNGEIEERADIFNTIFVSSHMYPEKPEETRAIVGSMNMDMDLFDRQNLCHTNRCQMIK